MNVPNQQTTLKYVDHTYRDFSRYTEEGGELIKHKKSTNNFPARLHKMLSDTMNSDVITWMVSKLLCVYLTCACAALSSQGTRFLSILSLTS